LSALWFYRKILSKTVFEAFFNQFNDFLLHRQGIALLSLKACSFTLVDQGIFNAIQGVRFAVLIVLTR